MELSPFLQMCITIISSILASSGLWAVLNTIIQRRHKKEDNRDEILIQIKSIKKTLDHETEVNQSLLDRTALCNEALMGVLHDRILYLGEAYIERGWIRKEEYENLYDNLYLPYKKLGGNGTASKIMSEVEKLNTRKSD